MKSKGFIKLIWIMLLMLILTGACLSGGNVSDTISKTEVAAHTSTATPLPSLTPSLTSTMTPLPTLTYEDKLATTKDLLTTNAGCKLPCWWGFTPGVTKWEDAKQLLETLITMPIYYVETDDFLIAEPIIPVPEEFSPSAGEFPGPGILYHNYFIENGIIEAIEVDVGLSHTYDLPKLLEEYGPPDEVYIETNPEPIKGVLPFYIYVFYEHKGLFAYYWVHGAEMGDYIQGCFMNRSVASMMLFSLDKGWSIKETTEKMRNVRISFSINQPYLLVEVTDMDEATFYQKYKGTTEPICITVPREPFYYYGQEPTPPTCDFPGESPY